MTRVGVTIEIDEARWMALAVALQSIAGTGADTIARVVSIDAPPDIRRALWQAVGLPWIGPEDGPWTAECPLCRMSSRSTVRGERVALSVSHYNSCRWLEPGFVPDERFPPRSKDEPRPGPWYPASWVIGDGRKCQARERPDGDGDVDVRELIEDELGRKRWSAAYRVASSYWNAEGQWL